MAAAKTRRWRLGVVFGAISAVAACSYSPQPKDGVQQCSTDRRCPDGYACSALNNRCYSFANPVQAAGTGGATSIDGGGIIASGGTLGRGATGGIATLPDSGGVADVGIVVANGGAIGADSPIVSPDAPGGADTAGGALDVPLGSGGTLGSGGSTGQDSAAGSDGGTGTGGSKMDASPGRDGASYDGSVGTGGTPAYNCANAIVPVSGVVTDFSDWNATTARWGSGTLTGSIYGYADPKATTSPAKVEGTPKGLHLAGTVPLQSYSGGGLTFFACVNAASFSKIQFDVYGSGSHCEIELQLQTFAQRPVDQSPPGSCKADGGAGCFAFPALQNIVDLSTAVAAPGKTVSANLASFTNWSTAAAGQIVGMQWQFLRSGNSDCVIDATFANIKFVP